jgi:transcription elongation GreA/GreB family factor
MSQHSFKNEYTKKLHLTQDGIAKLKKRLTEIKMKRSEAIRNLQSFDRNDIDDFYLSSEVQELENTEIEEVELRNLLHRAEPFAKNVTFDEVCVGCTVGLRSMGVTVPYTIVCSPEIDSDGNKISEDSLLGKAALKKKVGDSFSIITPKGHSIIYEIVSIE